MKILRQISVLGISALIILGLQGCSVVMALHGNDKEDLRSFYVGADRSYVHDQRGVPDKSVQDEDGKWIDTYFIVMGNERSSQRAFAHGFMDVLTFGLWEVMGTPIELASGVEAVQSFTIYYDSNNMVENVKSSLQKPQLDY